MTEEEQAKIIETNSMMEAIGFSPVIQEEKPDGIYVTYILPRKIVTKQATILQTGLPAAQ